MGDNSIRKVALPLEFISKEAIPRQFLGLNHFQEAESNIRFLFLFFFTIFCVNSMPFFSYFVGEFEFPLMIIYACNAEK